MPNNYFDFHFHPLFKKNLVKFEDSYPTKRTKDDISGTVILNNDLVNAADKKKLHIIDSQACIEQINSLMQAAGGGRFLGVANITCIEYAVTDVKGIAKAFLNIDLVSPLDVRYFNKVKNSEISYYQLLIKELSLYRQLQKDGVIVLLSRKNPGNDLNSLPAAQTYVLSIEGGHNLLRTKANLPCTVENLDTPQTLTAGIDNVYSDFQDNQHTLLTPAESLQHLHAAMWKDGLDIYYLTLTHLSYIQEKQLATHAYGMKLLNEAFFYPCGNGLSADGKAVIDAAYNMQADGKPTPLLIDVKHMSLKSRIDFYKYRKEKNYKWPIVATHMAVTGYSIKNWREALQDVQNVSTGSPLNPTTVKLKIKPKVGAYDKGIQFDTHVDYFFNTWAINLFNEDIVEIIKSGGIIGMILDARVLGLKETLASENEYETTQYLSVEEHDYLFNQQAPDIDDQSPLNKPKEGRGDFDFKLNYAQFKKDESPDMGMVSLALNILHIVAIARDKAKVEDPWQHIVIGSDYDGLIEPIPQVLDCTTISVVEQKLLELLPVIEEAYLHQNPTDSGGWVLPSKKNDKDVVDKDELKKKIRGIMFDNGKNFLNKWYQGMLLPALA